MIKSKFGQAKCQECSGWHWAVQLDDDLNPVEFKCCRCKRIVKFIPKIRVTGGASHGKD